MCMYFLRQHTTAHCNALQHAVTHRSLFCRHYLGHTFTVQVRVGCQKVIMCMYPTATYRSALQHAVTYRSPPCRRYLGHTPRVQVRVGRQKIFCLLTTVQVSASTTVQVRVGRQKSCVSYYNGTACILRHPTHLLATITLDTPSQHRCV